MMTFLLIFCSIINSGLILADSIQFSTARKGKLKL